MSTGDKKYNVITGTLAKEIIERATDGIIYSTVSLLQEYTYYLSGNKVWTENQTHDPDTGDITPFGAALAQDQYQMALEVLRLALKKIEESDTPGYIQEKMDQYSDGVLLDLVVTRDGTSGVDEEGLH